MGQRSQIYVRVSDNSGKKYLTARYYHWNYGERMVSRARHTLQWVKEQEYALPYLLASAEGKEKLNRILDTNFDYHDVVLGQDILKEYKSEREWCKEQKYFPPTFKQCVFDGQDNNDGQLFIDIIIDNDHRKRNGDCKVTYKYGFFMQYSADERKVIGPDEYMQADFRDDPTDEDYELWRESKYFKGCVKYTERNIKYIEKHAQLMTEEEALEFTNYDYITDMELEV